MPPILLLLLAMLSIQLRAVIAKSTFPIIGTFTVASGRLFFAAFLLMIAFRPWRVKIPKSSFSSLFVYGVSLGFMNLSFYLALERIPLGTAVAIEFLGPLSIAVFGRRSFLNFACGGLAFGGLLLLTPLTLSGLDHLGLFYALTAALCWAIYILAGRRAGQGLPATAAASIGMLIAALVVLPIGLYQTDFSRFQSSTVPSLIFIGLLSSAVPYTLEMIVLTTMTASTFGILLSLEPVIGAFLAWPLLGEILTVRQWCAVALIVVASALSVWTTRKRPSVT